MKLLYQDHEKALINEKRSKLLDTNSELYKFLDNLSNKIIKSYPNQVAPKRIDFHTQLLSRNENSPNLLVKKAQSIHNSNIDPTNPKNYYMMGRAFVLGSPEVESYGKTHITVAYFDGRMKVNNKIPELSELVKLL